MKSSATRAFLFCFLLCTYLNFVNGEDSKKNKFREREASDDALGYPNIDEDELLNTQCPKNLELRWQTEVSSSIYAAPLIADINSDGKLDIVVPTFLHYLEVLEGSDGDKMPGWPAFHQSTVHSSPLLYDIDKDGVREIALATYNGEVLFFRVSGYMMADKLEIPRRRVRKDWFVGLLQDPVDRSHPDVHDDQLIQEAAEIKLMTQINESSHGPKTSVPTSTEGNLGILNASKPENKEKMNESQIETNIKLPKTEDNLSTIAGSVGTITPENGTEIKLPKSEDNLSTNAGSVGTINQENGTTSARRLLEDNDSKGLHEGNSESKGTGDATLHAATVENNEGLEAEADSSFELFRDNGELADEYNYDYDDNVDETMWGDEEWTEADHEKLEDYVNIDSHILSTPVIADIDNDGVSEMVVGVSYFFDHEYYDNPEHLKELGGIEIGKYVAGAIVVYNLDTKQVKWTTQLDLSTDTGNFRAYIYSSPTVVDLDGDGNLDILVGTNYGLFYVLDHHGSIREKFPLEMAGIQGAIVAADINDDGKIELVTTDVHGNVAAWTSQGVIVWETHVKSLVPQGPTVGDVDGDGHTDVVVSTLSGNIYVLSGKDGSVVRPYPYRTHGRVMNQVLLVDLTKRGEKKKGLTLVTTSFDGYLYLIDGPTSCTDVVDIGETSYSIQHQRLKQQQHALMQQAMLQQQSLYHPGLLAAPQIEPIPSGNLPPGFDPSTCRSVYVGNIHTQVTEPLLQEVFASTGLIEGCKLIRKEKSSYGFVHYFDRRSASLAILSLNGRHLFGQPIKVNWAYASGQREDTSSHFNIFVGDLSPEVTDATLFACFSVYPSCSDARVMWDQKTGRSRGFGFVSFRNQQDAQSAINDLTGKWLGSRQIRCNWATKGAGANDDKQSSDSKSVVELTNGSEDGKEVANNEAAENNPQFTTVYVGNLAPEVTQLDLHRHFHSLGAGLIEEVRVQRDKGFGFVRYNTHAEAALAIQLGNTQSLLCGKAIKCSWGSKPTPPGTSSNPLPPPAAAPPMPGLSPNDILAYERQLAMSKMGGVHALMHPQGQHRAGGASQAIYDGGFQNVAAAQQLMYYQ